MGSCKNICLRLATSVYVGNARYTYGLVYCKGCEVYFTKDKIHKKKFCPCCGSAVRFTAIVAKNKVVTRY